MSPEFILNLNKTKNDLLNLEKTNIFSVGIILI